MEFRLDLPPKPEIWCIIKDIMTLPSVDLDQFLGEFKSNRRLVEYVKTLLQWTEIAEKFNKLFAVQGGFAVELAVGKVTRSHDDLDIILFANEASWFKERFPVDGYKLKYLEGKNPEQHFCAYRYNFIIEDCIYVDMASIYVGLDEVWDDEDGPKSVWPIKPSELFWERKVGGQNIKFLNPKIVHEFKKIQREKKEKRDKEIHDFDMLKKFVKAGL